MGMDMQQYVLRARRSFFFGMCVIMWDFDTFLGTGTE